MTPYDDNREQSGDRIAAHSRSNVSVGDHPQVYRSDRVCVVATECLTALWRWRRPGDKPAEE
jgi:hypothetical protein